ncbi:MAG: DUF294 nucleotidyltransferase-like domain-containing protein [Chloroflexaceae bacterium]
MTEQATAPDTIARFLAHYPPFSELPFDQVESLAGSVQVRLFAPGEDILVYGGSPNHQFFMVRAGSVDLLREDEQGVRVFDTLGTGEFFGYPSLIHSQSPLLTVRTCMETCIYSFSEELFHQLRRAYPAFARFFADSAIEWLSYRLQAHYAHADPVLFQMCLRDLVRRALITVAPEASVRQAAQIMREYDVSSLVVTSTPTGIITDRDLRNRVLAAGLDDTTRVSEVMTMPALTLPADSLVFEGLLTMLERDIHQMPITENNQVIGLVTRTDIMRRRSHSPLFLPRQLQRAQSIERLRTYSHQIVDTVGTLLDAGARTGDIGRVVTVARDGMLTRLLQDAEEALGPPPCPYAWLLLGSAGRYEQTLHTDQDNALVYADDASPGAADYFTALAEQVVTQLVACGIPRCPGNVMATNAIWRQPLAVWKNYFTDWIYTPDEEALLQVTIFFDFRQVYGTLDADAALRAVIRQARERQVFLARVARTALRQAAPLGFFRQVLLERNAEGHDRLDLKQRGIALIVDLARLFALEAGCTATNTPDRLRMSVAGSSLSATSCEELTAAFELLNLLRLRHQYQQIQRDVPPDNHLLYSQLSPLEQRELKEALHAIARMQRSVAFLFQTEKIA